MLEKSDLQGIREVVREEVQGAIKASEVKVLSKVKIMIEESETMVLLAIKDILDIKFKEMDEVLALKPSTYHIQDWCDRRFQRLAE